MSLWLCTHCSYGPISITHKGLTSSHALGYQKKREEMKNRKRRKKNKSTKITEKKKIRTSHATFIASSSIHILIDEQANGQRRSFFFLFFPFFLQLHFSLGVNELTSRISNNASLISLISDRPIKVSVFVWQFFQWKMFFLSWSPKKERRTTLFSGSTIRGDRLNIRKFIRFSFSFSRRYSYAIIISCR